MHVNANKHWVLNLYQIPSRLESCTLFKKKTYVLTLGNHTVYKSHGEAEKDEVM